MKQTPIAPKPKPDNWLLGISIVTIIVAAALICFGAVNYVQNREQQIAIEEQNKRTAQLVEEIKKLSEGNQKLSQTTVNYAYCNAMLLAKYTQDQSPIEIEDLNACVLKSFPEGDAPALQSSLNVVGSSAIARIPSLSDSQNTTPRQSTQTPLPTQPTTPTVPTTPSAPVNPQPNQPLISLQPSGLLPILNIVPDITIPGIITIR